MKALLILPLLGLALLAQPELRHEKQALLELEREKNSAEYDTLKKSWIAPLHLNASYKQSKEASSQLYVDTSNANLKFDQEIFRSGGIVYAVRYAQSAKRLSDLRVDTSEAQLKQALYTALITAKKLALTLDQSHAKLDNLDIEILIRKEQYVAGEVDITFLNNAIMNKTAEELNFVTLRSSLRDAELEVAKYTDPLAIAMELPELTLLDENAYLDESLELRTADEAITSAAYRKKTLRSSYLPKLSLNAEVGYTRSEHENPALRYDGNYNAIGVSATLPIDINMFSTLESARVEELLARSQRVERQQEQQQQYRQLRNRIQQYEDKIAVIERTLALYEELEIYTREQVLSGFKTQYDLLTLQNMVKIQKLEAQIQRLAVQSELLTLHFATRSSLKD